jgi:hypothetical protein
LPMKESTTDNYTHQFLGCISFLAYHKKSHIWMPKSYRPHYRTHTTAPLLTK